MIPVQFITHYTDRYSYLDSARLALEGGCRWIQLRMKDHPLDEVEAIGREVQALCKHYGAIFIIDDHVELAQKLHADGVHLGLKDMPVAEARQVLGEEFLIGGTANTFEPLLGLEGYARLMKQMQEAGIPLPVVAIGGITRADIPAIMETGVRGIALSGTVLRADDPVQEMREILTL